MVVPWTDLEEAESRVASRREPAAPDAATAESTAEPAVGRSRHAAGRSTAQHLGMMLLNFGEASRIPGELVRAGRLARGARATCAGDSRDDRAGKGRIWD